MRCTANAPTDLTLERTCLWLPFTHTHRVQLLQRKVAVQASVNHGALLALSPGTTNARGRTAMDVPRAPVLSA